MVVAMLGSGIPASWQIILYVLTGLLLIFWSLLFVVKHRREEVSKQQTDTFVQNGNVK